MKTTIALASLAATVVLAKPYAHQHLHEKRAWNIVEDIETVYTTVTETAGAAAAAATGGWSWGDWGNWHHSPASPAAATTAAPAPVPVVTENPVAVTTTATWAAPTQAPASPPPASPPAPASPPPAAAPPAAAPSSPSQGTGPGGVDIAAILDQHNNHRWNASVPSLTWSDEMASIAAEIAASCTYAHNTAAGGGGYGQNIGAGAPPQDIPAMITNEMYNDEINFYPLPYGIEPDMSNFEKWGHYSQIVWKNTVSVGCAVQDCSAQGLAGVGSGVSPFFAVCNYSPPGNFGGEYGANVLPPNGGAPSVNVPN